MSIVNRLNDRRYGILFSYLNTGTNMVCGLLISSFLLRMLGSTEYGLYKTMSSFVGMLVMFEFGTGTVMTRNITLSKSKKQKETEIKRNISTIWGITIILAIIILVIASIFYFSLEKVYIHSMSYDQIEKCKTIFIFVTINLIVAFLSQTLNGIILAYEYYSYASIISIFTIITRALLLILVLLKYDNAIAVSIIDAVIGTIVLVITIYFCIKGCNVKFTLKLFDKTIFINSLPLCIAIFMQTVVNQMNNNIDNFLIGIKLNPESVALYSVGLYVFSIFSSATTIPISLYAPQVITDIGEGKRGKELTKTLVQPSRLIAIVGGSILFGFIVAGKEFITIVYGKEYIKAWYVALLLMIPMFINMTSGVVVNVLDGLNKRIARSYVLILTTLLNFILTIIWLDKWGIMGASVATAVSTIIGQIIIMHIYYSRKIGIHVFYLFREAYRGILVFQIISMVGSLIIKQFFINVVSSFFVSAVVYVVVFFSLYILFGVNSEEKKVIKGYIRKVKR